MRARNARWSTLAQFQSMSQGRAHRVLTRGCSSWLTKRTQIHSPNQAQDTNLHDLTTCSSEACAQQVGPDLQCCVIGGIAVVQAIMCASRSTACTQAGKIVSCP